MKLARNSDGLRDLQPYACKYPWPESDDCFVQCGGNGIVLTEGDILDSFTDPASALATIMIIKNSDPSANSNADPADPGSKPSTPPLPPHYRTAFFEAFVPVPDTFIRGEGQTIELAEESAWSQYQKYLACDHGPYEPRDYQNGAGFCVKCGLWFPHVIPPFHPCHSCNTPTWFSQDNAGDWWCENCYPSIPEDRLTDMMRKLREWQKEDIESEGGNLDNNGEVHQ